MIKDKKKIYNLVFFSSFIISFLGCNIFYYRLLNVSINILSLSYIFLLEFITFGFAYNISSVILTLISEEYKIPFIKKLEIYPPVALVCCVCNDANLYVLKKLKNQNYPDLDIFILDDSDSAESKKTVDSAGIKVIRRPDRNGFKAGNLNNWLFNYGHKYKYFVVADSDSILPCNFINDLACYAEHPDNFNIILFESLLETWNKNESLFVKFQTVTSPLTHRERLREGNILKTNLSIGHNNLYRTKAMMGIGGFNQNYLSEDHATAIDIIRSGKWIIVTVPVISYERMPGNLNEFNKRHTRYAVQTFQLLNISMKNIPWIVRMNIIRDIHNHSMPVIFVLSNISLIAFNILAFISAGSMLKNKELLNIILSSNYISYWVLFLLVQIALQSVVIIKEKISIKDYFYSVIHTTALFTASAWCVLKKLYNFTIHKKIFFMTTGTEIPPSFTDILKIQIPVYILLAAALITVILNPIFSILNLIWILPCLMSPFIINHNQRKKS